MNKLRPYILYNDKFLNSVSWFFRVGGIALFPFVILRERYKGEDPTVNKETNDFWKDRGKKTINHETIHFQQALELAVIPFYVLYILEYVIKTIVYLNVQKAYRNISFEREAYNNEKDYSYLDNRKRYNWLKLIF